jgi:hypothetical protein
MTGKLSLQSLDIPATTFEQLRTDKHFRDRMALLGDAKLKLDSTTLVMSLTKTSESNESFSSGELTKIRNRIECAATHAKFMRAQVTGATALFGDQFYDANDHTISQYLEALIGILLEKGALHEQALIEYLCRFALPADLLKTSATPVAAKANDKKKKKDGNRSVSSGSASKRLFDGCECGDVVAVHREMQFVDINSRLRPRDGFTALIVACMNARRSCACVA